MLVILVIAFIATLGFYQQACRVGRHPGKAASIPFIAAGLMVAFTYVAAMGMGWLLSTVDLSETTILWIGTGMEWFLILAFTLFIKRNWDRLTSAPINSENMNGEMMRDHEGTNER